MEAMDPFPRHLICHLCYKPFNDPRMLPCLHSFCSECLQREVEKTGPQESIQCPTCEESVPVQAHGEANLFPPNLHLEFEVDVAQCMSLFGSDEISCSFCVNGCPEPAVTFCCSCRQFMCSFGQESHARIPHLLGHAVIGVDKESASKLPVLMEPLSDHRCSEPQHANQSMAFYCSTCRCLVCRDCTVVIHRDHDISELPGVAASHRDEMKEVLTCAQDAAAKLTTAIGDIKMAARQVEMCKQNAELTIDRAFRQLEDDLKERKRALLSELESLSLSKTVSLNLMSRSLEKMQRDLCHGIEVTSHILQTHTDQEVITLKGMVPNALRTAIGKVSIPICERSCFAFALKRDLLTGKLSELGSITDVPPAPGNSKYTIPVAPIVRQNSPSQIQVQTMSTNGDKYICGGLQVSAELELCASARAPDGEVVTHGSVEDHGDGTYTITVTPSYAGPHQLCITVEGEQVEGSPRDLEVAPDYTAMHNPPQHVIDVTGRPYCVAIHQNGDIYVGSESDHISVFESSDGGLKRTIGSKGSGSGQFRGPAGIAIDGGALFVADFYNNRVQVLTTEGSFLREFGEKGSGQRQFSGPWDVKVDAWSRLIVSDSGNNRLQVLDQEGVWLQTIDGNTLEEKSFKSPRGLSLDPEGSIHIAAYGSNTIVVFTTEGEFFKTYGPVKRPMGVFVNAEGYSFVSERNGGCVSIYDPLGCKIHVIGNLDNPFGIVLDNQNEILYIANCGGSSVLKFSVYNN